ANGTRYDGGTGRDGMQLVQTDGPTQTSDTYSVGPVIGSGISRIVGPGGTQTVFFENLSPVLDLVPSALLTVNATAADNAINYGGFGFFGGQVTIDEQEAIAFANKTQLKINAESGQDTVNLSNPSITPLGLTNIQVDGGDPSSGDTLIVSG